MANLFEMMYEPMDDDDELRSIVANLQAMRQEFEEENNLAEERENERARQRFSVR